MLRGSTNRAVPNADKGEGVKKSINFADIINGGPLQVAAMLASGAVHVNDGGGGGVKGGGGGVVMTSARRSSQGPLPDDVVKSSQIAFVLLKKVEGKN